MTSIGNVRHLAVACAVAWLGSGVAQAQEMLRIAGGEVKVVCPLTVGGSFEARTKALSGDVKPAKARGRLTGALRVKLDTLETGIAMRDKHLRTNYLEVQKGRDYATAVLENIRVDSLSGKGTFRGTLLLHGKRREVIGTSAVQRKDGTVRVDAEFPVKVSAFAIPEPTYLGVGVRDEVRVKVSLTARPVTVAASR